MTIRQALILIKWRFRRSHCQKLRIEAICLAFFATMLFVPILALASSSEGASDAWQVTDWSDDSVVATSDLDGISSPGELILKNDLSSMVFAFDPTDWESVMTMAVYKENLFLGASTRPNNVDGGDVIKYEYESDTFSIDYQVYEQGIMKMKVLGDKLYIPGTDSQGSWEWGNIYIYDGTSWVRKATVPWGVHVRDIGLYKGNLYVAAETPDHSIVYTSSDEGNSWKKFLSEAETNQSYFSIFSYADELYLTSIPHFRDSWMRLGLTIYNGSATNYMLLPSPYSGGITSTFEEFNGKLYVRFGKFMNSIVPGGLNPEMQFDVLAVPGAITLWYLGGLPEPNLQKIGNKLFAVTRFHEPQSSVILSSTNGSTWKVEDSSNEDEVFRSIVGFHGRLYAGVTAKDDAGGKIYVSSAIPKGVLTSEIHEFDEPITNGRIFWNALVQPGTDVVFQVRSGQSANELAKKPFIGPDGKTTEYYRTSGSQLNQAHNGDRFAQYRVILQTKNPALMPVLQDVTIKAGG